MKGKTERFNKVFLWIMYDNDGPITIVTIEGHNLLKSIMIQFQHNNSFLYWDKKHFETKQTPEEKAIAVLELLDKGRQKDNIIVLDITNSVYPILLFPKDKRDSGFDDKIIGYKYSIDAYIKATEDEDQVTFKSFGEAKNELESLSVLQPENIYRLRNITKDEDVITS